MIVISHRRNKIVELTETPPELGVEVDIRSYGEKLIIHHDPFVPGESFEAWLDAYRHRMLILNVKEEGLEDRLLGLMERRGINDFFFLDQSFPFLVRTARRGERRCAVRVSEYENIETALALAGRIDWVWVDCFTRFPLDYDNGERLRLAGFKLCLVSPELQGRPEAKEIAAIRRILDEEGIKIDAVCTKTPFLWA
ncbi:Glycerophosphodiester phosphodiesterase [Azospirillaceae bacterium]